jgi:hypothetical protein
VREKVEFSELPVGAVFYIVFDSGACPYRKVLLADGSYGGEHMEPISADDDPTPKCYHSLKVLKYIRFSVVADPFEVALTTL